ncbi:MAG: DNA polymerase III subunit beta [Gammaproteobacteria bacterium]
MKIKVIREDLLRPLQGIAGVVERRQTLPVLSNVRIDVEPSGAINLMTSDLEVEMTARMESGGNEEGSTTVPARKLLDICRALPEGVNVTLQAKEGRLLVTASKSRFALATLAAEEFPRVGELEGGVHFHIQQEVLMDLLKRTSFAMAQQDVRYYLTGLLLEVGKRRIRAVATDGHRLALRDAPGLSDLKGEQSVIVPRKAVIELERLLGQSDGLVEIVINSRNASFGLGALKLTSKLIEGQFPDYGRVIPTQSRHRLLADREPLREALARVAILANEKFRGVRLEVTDNSLKLVAHNPENEEAEEELAVHYAGEQMVIAFNAGYLQDALAALDTETVEFSLTDANSSVMMGMPGVESCQYVIMPMRL